MTTRSMPDSGALIELAPRRDLAEAAEQFARHGWVQIHPFLTETSAARLRSLLERRTPWSLAWQAAEEGPHVIRAADLGKVDQPCSADIRDKLTQAMADGRYAFSYLSYPLVQAMLERWAPGGEHEQLLAEINQPQMLSLARAVTGVAEIVKADGQATLYAPGHFLARHNDHEPGRGRRAAYVLSLSGESQRPWRAEWGGALQFLTDDGVPCETLLPSFNTLNLFHVPRMHHVTSVAPFAPATRFAVTGWFRDR